MYHWHHMDDIRTEDFERTSHRIISESTWMLSPTTMKTDSWSTISQPHVCREMVPGDEFNKIREGMLLERAEWSPDSTFLSQERGDAMKSRGSFTWAAYSKTLCPTVQSVLRNQRIKVWLTLSVTQMEKTEVSEATVFPELVGTRNMGIFLKDQIEVTWEEEWVCVWVSV